MRRLAILFCILALALFTLTACGGGGGGGSDSGLFDGTEDTGDGTETPGDGTDVFTQNVALSFSPQTVAPSQSTTIIATVTDTTGNAPVPNEQVSFSVQQNSSGGSFISGTATTDANGKAYATYTCGTVEGTDIIAAQTSNSDMQEKSLIVAGTAPSPTGLSLVSASDSINADGISSTELTATVTGVGNGVEIFFSTTAGSFPNGPTDTVLTDINGEATITLTASTTVTTANISAFSGGYSDSVSVNFIAAEPVAANSSIIADPGIVPANGTGTTTVTVVLKDLLGNPVQDNTQVRLETTAGTVSAPNPTVTSGGSGTATFTLMAPSVEGTADLSVEVNQQVIAGLTGSVVFGSVEEQEPASIQMSAADPTISIAGVGQQESTTITINIVDSNGNPIDEAFFAGNTARVSFNSHPHGGEFISGVNADGETVTTKDDSSGEINILTSDGQAQLTLRSGVFPGVVEIKVQAIDTTGTLMTDPDVVAILSQISIASGPPHTIALSSSNNEAIEDLNPQYAAYRRAGTALVTDRYGNNVPDGTVIHLGLIDSVVSMGSTGTVDKTAAPPFSPMQTPPSTRTRSSATTVLARFRSMTGFFFSMPPPKTAAVLSKPNPPRQPSWKSTRLTATTTLRET